MAAHAGLLALLVLGVLTALPGAQAQISCNVAANWTETAPLIGFLGVGAACPAAETTATVQSCGQCVCSAGILFQDSVNTTEFIANLNSTDAGGFGLFSDFLSLCINNQASSFTELESTQAGVRACLADSTFQSTVGGSVTGLQAYCRSSFAPSPPAGTTAPPPPGGNAPPVPDIIPEESSEESSGEESSAEASPPPFPPGTVFPPPFPPGTILPPPYPPGFVFPPSPPGVYPPGVYPPPPSPGSGASVQRTTLLLQAAVALVALLCSFALLL